MKSNKQKVVNVRELYSEETLLQMVRQLEYEDQFLHKPRSIAIENKWYSLMFLILDTTSRHGFYMLCAM